MVEQLCQAYHWSFEQAMSLTMPQIILFNHACWLTHEKSERRSKDKTVQEDEAVWKGKRVEQLNSEEFAAYMSHGL